MPVDQPRAPTRGAVPAAAAKPAAVSIPQFRLCLPDVSIESPMRRSAAHENPKSPAPLADKPPAPSSPIGDSRQRPSPPRDAGTAAPTRLSDSEKRYAAGQREVAGMIEELRGKRQRLFRRLWFASVLLTAASVVALGVELLQRTDLLHYFGGSDSTAEPSVVGKSRKVRSVDAGKSQPDKSDAPRVWSNGLPGEDPEKSSGVEHVGGEKSVSEQIGHSERSGVWLPGTITDIDSEKPDRGDIHDDHQPRTP
jgi:hypothetical protein